MANDRTPYFASRIECPVCGYLNSFEIIKQGSYTESGKDTDFAPIGRVWKNQSFQGHNPLLYFTGTCNNCYYTREINSSYKEWQNDSGYRTYRLPIQKKKHLNEIAQDDSMIKALGERIDYKSFPNESAIIKLLLAIYDELLLERPTSLDLARYYLRIAWIYREMSSGETDSMYMAQITVSNIQNEIDRLKNYLEGLGDRIAPLAGMIDDDLEYLVSSHKSGSEISSGMREKIDTINRLWGDIQENTAGLESEFNLARKELTGFKGEEKVLKDFGEHSGFDEFLCEIRERWQGIPLNQSESLNFALQYYLKAYQNSKEIKPGLQQLQASYMIAELSRRVGSNKQAMEYFKNTSKQAHEMMNRNRSDKTIFANARKILEMSLEQARLLKKPEKVNK